MWALGNSGSCSVHAEGGLVFLFREEARTLGPRLKAQGEKDNVFICFSTRGRALEWLWGTVVGSAQDWSSVCVGLVGGGERGSLEQGWQ